MHHNLPPQDPAKFGPGVTYNARGERIDRKDETVDNRPRIARMIGKNIVEDTIALDSQPLNLHGMVERSSPESIPLGPGFLKEVAKRAEAELRVEEQIPQSVPVSEMQRPLGGNSYAGSASRQMDLERAEAINIERAASQAGMTVDQYMAARHQRNQQIMKQNKRSL